MPELPRWTLMWGLALASVAAAKAIVLRAHGPARAAWTWGWPGMDPERFHRAPSRSPGATETGWAVARTCAGGLLLWGVGPRLAPPARAWVGILALGLLLHFGLLHLLSIHWRRRGWDARPLFAGVTKATSLGDFWGRRWNRAFADFSRRCILKPLAPRFGTRPALLAVYLASGVGHDLVLSLPAGGGYGLCTLYFLIQGLGVLLERRRRSRALALALIIVPLPLLFHASFRSAVLLPFLEVIS